MKNDVKVCIMCHNDIVENIGPALRCCAVDFEECEFYICSSCAMSVYARAPVKLTIEHNEDKEETR